MTTENSKLIDLQRPPVTEKAIVVRLALPTDSDEEVEESLDEIRRLAWTAGAEVACAVVQRRAKPSPGTLIGMGKVHEVQVLREELEADFIIFDSDLTPSQGAKLGKLLGAKVIDRTQLILDIFAQRAQTNEGKHQVELALLQYTLPRLRGTGSAMMRQQGGIGVRGPGEQKLEVDRRVIRTRITRLRNELESIKRRRRVQRGKRIQGAVGTAALVGYTNAGKSSLLNALTEADAFVEDKLFATLDPTSRRYTLPSQREVVFTDTVGFIRKLPHTLVAAFRATLEEVNEADLLLIVVDASHPAAFEHLRSVREVLEEIEVGDRPSLLVFNKIDIAGPGVVRELASHAGQGIPVSARTGEGLEGLLDEVEQGLAPTWVRVQLRIPQRDGAVVAHIHKHGLVISQSYEGDEVLLTADIAPVLKNQVARFIVA